MKFKAKEEEEIADIEEEEEVLEDEYASKR